MDGYGEEFYRGLHDYALRSARVVVPLVVDLLRPGSVVDVGCGTGAWLAAFREQGVGDVVGVDGPGVPRDALAIPADRFLARDLRRPLTLGRRFDLAVCLETAEHLPTGAADGLVGSLAGLAPWVLFSAAVPHQGGTGHVNERWPDYWAGRFEGRGYAAVDCLRGRVWQDPRVCWWYAQNLLLFGEERAVRGHPRVCPLWERTERSRLAVVHPQLYMQMAALAVRAQAAQPGRVT